MRILIHESKDYILSEEQSGDCLSSPRFIILPENHWFSLPVHPAQFHVPWPPPQSSPSGKMGSRGSASLSPAGAAQRFHQSGAILQSSSPWLPVPFYIPPYVWTYNSRYCSYLSLPILQFHSTKRFTSHCDVNTLHIKALWKASFPDAFCARCPCCQRQQGLLALSYRLL